ncbi:hypothetical protein NN561_001404 [Cricetulus griseus]
MLSDVLALVVALVAERFARRTHATQKNTFGWIRAEVMGALVNAIFLTGLCFAILLEAVERFIEPHEMQQPLVVLGVGVAGLLVNEAQGTLGQELRGFQYQSVAEEAVLEWNQDLDPYRISSLDRVPLPISWRRKSPAHLPVRALLEPGVRRVQDFGKAPALPDRRLHRPEGASEQPERTEVVLEPELRDPCRRELARPSSQSTTRAPLSPSVLPRMEDEPSRYYVKFGLGLEVVAEGRADGIAPVLVHGGTHA